jgi:two-component system, cell cycle sensor histidine kinase and response regulator CckA
MALKNENHRHGKQMADELRGTSKKLTKRQSGLRLTEEGLRKDAETFRAIADTLPVGVSVAEDLKLTWANSAFMKIHRFESPNDYVGQSIEMLFASREEFDRAGRAVRSDLETGNVVEIVAKQKRKDGSLFDAKLRLALFSASDPAKRTVMCYTTDMSPQIEAADELRRSEERYRASLEESFDGALIVQGSKILFANSRLGEMLGYPREDLEGMEYSGLLHPDYRELVARRAAARIRGESVPGCYDLKLLRRDGVSFDVELSARVTEIEGTPCSQIWIRDVSERKRAEENLRRSEERYRALVEQSFDGVIIHDGRKISFASSRICDMLGYSKDELEGMDLSLTIHPDDRELVTNRAIARLRGESLPDLYELKLQRKDGYVLEAETNARAIVVEGRRVIQAWVRDISERKRAQEIQRKSDERYRTLVEESFDGIMIHDDAKIVFANSRLCEMLGYQKEELEGMDYRQTVHPDYRDIVAHRAAARMRGEDVPSRYEIKHQRKDGSSFDSEVNARPIEVQGAPGVQVWIKDISERKKAEEAVRQSEERYRTLVEESFDGIMILDGKKIVLANSRLCEMLGYEKDELEGMDHWITLHPDYRGTVNERLAARMHGESPPSVYECKQLRKDGSSFESEVNSRAIQAQGVPLIQVWIKDISERKKAEEALRKSEEKYRLVFDNAAAGINLNSHGRILEANAAFANMLGYSRDELAQIPFSDVTHPNDLKITEQSHDKLIRGEADSRRFEKRYIRKDGSIVWADVWAAAIRDQTGEYRGGISAVIDITERKRAEEALQRSEANYRTIFDSMNDAIFVHDAETGVILDVNQKMCEMYGYTREEARRLTAEALGSGEEEYCHELALQRIKLAAGGEPQLFEWQSKTKDGQPFWVEVNLRKATLNDKPCVLAVVRDIADRKWSEQERENLRHQLLHAQKMEALGTLVGGIAHDFNNLLTIILGYSELLLVEKGEDDPGAADLKKVIEAASSGAALVQRMLTFSDQRDTMLGPLNLNSEIENMRELLSRTIPKTISLDLRPSDDLSLIDGDAGQIQQVIMNLALNAVDAMPSGGRLTIETKNAILDEHQSKNHSRPKSGNHVLLSVSDTGHGMGNQTMKRMYEPFFTTKNRDFTKGTGLGLAIVHGIVQGHGGTIMCRSEPEKGTRFDLYFPALSYEELISKERAEDSIATTHSAQGAETILLVDDDELVRGLGARILKRAGYETLNASNGKEALAVYKRRMGEIALVILDLIMPEMDGERCLEEILRINPKAKVIISTGYSSNDEMTRIRIEALAAGFVAKPFALSDMLKTVREILDRE